jgi:hypothetical protein
MEREMERTGMPVQRKDEGEIPSSFVRAGRLMI